MLAYWTSLLPLEWATSQIPDREGKNPHPVHEF